MTENVPNLVKEIDIQAQEAQSPPNNIPRDPHQEDSVKDFTGTCKANSGLCGFFRSGISPFVSAAQTATVWLSLSAQ